MTEQVPICKKRRVGGVRRGWNRRALSSAGRPWIPRATAWIASAPCRGPASCTQARRLGRANGASEHLLVGLLRDRHRDEGRPYEEDVGRTLHHDGVKVHARQRSAHRRWTDPKMMNTVGVSWCRDKLGRAAATVRHRQRRCSASGCRLSPPGIRRGGAAAGGSPSATSMAWSSPRIVVGLAAPPRTVSVVGDDQALRARHFDQRHDDTAAPGRRSQAGKRRSSGTVRAGSTRSLQTLADEHPCRGVDGLHVLAPPPGKDILVQRAPSSTSAAIAAASFRTRR